MLVSFFYFTFSEATKSTNYLKIDSYRYVAFFMIFRISKTIKTDKGFERMTGTIKILFWYEINCFLFGLNDFYLRFIFKIINVRLNI
jgi:hypothetical protein